MSTETKNQYKFLDDGARFLGIVFCFSWEAGKTFLRDCISKKVPGVILTWISIFLATCLLLRVDAWVLWHLHLPHVLPGSLFYRLYVLFIAGLPYFVWAIGAQMKRASFLRDLEIAFMSIPLKSALGAIPTYVKERAIDKDVRALFLKNPHISIMEFNKKKDQIGSALKGRVLEITEHREKHLVEIKYAKHELDAYLTCKSPGSYPNFSFFVGEGYEKTVTASLLSYPHLLVGGQTGGGKSAFLRQFITTMFLSNQGKVEMTLVDFKNGMEFSMFDGLPNVKVFYDIPSAVPEIQKMKNQLKTRGEILRKAGYTNVSDLPLDKAMMRQILVVDEAADMFLNGPKKNGKDIADVREAVSEIARKGRAVGLHLVIATQKPDSKALDPQVKSCLTAAVCFRMVDDASSISIIGNGRATDLPPIEGRAIWKTGGEQIEVQTPMLTSEAAKEFLGRPNKNADKQNETSSEVNHVIPGGNPPV